MRRKTPAAYFGTVKTIKQLQDIKDVVANVVYEGDELEIAVENGRKKLVKHVTDWRNADKPIIAAYCIISKNDGDEFFEIMTKAQIDKSWSKAKTKNVQIDFPDQMAMRTVINRAAKLFINTSDDSDLLAGAINNTIADEYEDGRQTKDVTPEQSAETLDGILGTQAAPEAEGPQEKEVINQELTAQDANLSSEEVPSFNEETGEVIDQEPETGQMDMLEGEDF